MSEKSAPNESDEQSTKNVLIVSAHPEPRSLNASLASFAAEELRRAGHHVRTSDLYAMKWKAGVDADDFPDHSPADRLDVMAVSGDATERGRLAGDIAAEQEKLLWSDAVILQFPMWWFSVPAVLKGWIDRVFTYGFGYGDSRMPRYGDGVLAGRRAMLSLTVGARDTAFSARGVHGPMDQVLFPLQHGLLHYTGMEVLEPFVVWHAIGLGEDAYEAATREYRERLRTLFTAEPIPFRTLKDGDYTRSLELRPGLETPGSSGLALHVRGG
ncbi:NAD(P)H-dependent oxidoreductase [Streptomyces litchfieldiae]|uniref:NAD(P)H-dependent oxidoreductase n=1 Tax=Streptomyces litchfieldiae TaxID=3075543 RepID=A0ABU2MX81_9ACTN|nr:NAD(P)H-dependent oxidoreductase [Streptomyces sp. DSM 44938]MDT0345987.1 NAD(P)H-dependent oxidoreductase [Streptomyces sp. DSM 44938]